MQANQLLDLYADTILPMLNNTGSQPTNDFGSGRGNSSGRGSGKGTMTTTQSTSNPSLNTATQQSGRGSGSGSKSTTHAIVSRSGVTKVHPLTSGTGSNVDTYIWSPHSGANSGSGTQTYNNLASNPENWIKDGATQDQNGTVPGNKPTDIAEFDPTWIISGNSPDITWDYAANFSTMELVNGYTGEQSVESGIDLLAVDAGNVGFSMDASSDFNVNLGKGCDLTFNGTPNELKGFNITGDSTAKVIINSGTTYIARYNLNGPPYTENLGVSLTINNGATLSHEGQNTLNLTTSNLVITVKGTMDTFPGPGASNILIQQGNQVSGSYIDVTGGTLSYEGTASVEDTIAVPVLVENNGNFIVTSSGGGWLIVKGQVAQTQKYSVYMTSGSVSLAQATTLECDDDYRQDNGTLQTTDSSYCALQDGAGGGGTAVIAGGSLVINNSASSGRFGVDATNLNFAGKLFVGIQANQSGQNGQLIASGTMNLQAGNSLGINEIGQLNNGNWTIIDNTGNNNIGQFTNGANPAPGLTGHNNQPKAGDYQVTSP